jgi:2-hydroxychromene-2-carboxylate isomerase
VTAPVLYLDLQSPYAYLAVERAESVLGVAPVLEPILLGAFFARRGFGSWADTDERPRHLDELAARVARYGLPPLALPPQWPTNGIALMRAATWAKHEGRIDPFARAVFRSLFAGGAAVADPEVMLAAARAAGLDPGAMEAAIQTDAIKDELRRATEAAWEAGVRGVPTVLVSGQPFYGDDRLLDAAGALTATIRR